MNNVVFGTVGTDVELIQSVLKRNGFYDGAVTGNYDNLTKVAVIAFQTNYRLRPDGEVGYDTWHKLQPFIDGYDTYTIQRGDTLYQIAAGYGTTVNQILTANPGTNVYDLHIGQQLLVPFCSIIPTDISYTYNMMRMNLSALQITYPFLEMGDIGYSVLSRKIPYVKVGKGPKKVFYGASFHANEWITTPVLMKFIEQYSKAYTNNGMIYGEQAAQIYDSVSIYIVPMINPDGVDLVTGAFRPGSLIYEGAEGIAEHFPDIPFPAGWKANIDGVDLNLQFPAHWETAKQNKFKLGFDQPAPRDYVGAAPLVANEAKAVYDFTLEHDFDLILAYHTQGRVIYWQFLDYLPENSYELGKQLSESSGYTLEVTPYAASFAGYKDWFIQQYNRPGYTIEAGIGENPLPISQFDQIYIENEGILVLSAILS